MPNVIGNRVTQLSQLPCGAIGRRNDGGDPAANFATKMVSCSLRAGSADTDGMAISANAPSPRL